MSGIRERLLISTIDSQAPALARLHGLGLELADFCAAMDLDGNERIVREQAMARSMNGLSRFVLHAPFCELTPCAVDPLVGKVSRDRYEQAFELARAYGVERLVVHSGFIPNVYDPRWYLEQAPLFWRDFLADKPAGFQLLLENVLDDEPTLLPEAVRRIADPRVGLCLDIGHAAVYSRHPLKEWIACFLPALRHVHLHDNDGMSDLHLPLGQGKLPLEDSILALEAARPSYTLENMDAAPSLDWLRRRGLL